MLLRRSDPLILPVIWKRVRRLAINLGILPLNWNTEDIAILEFGAILHDIGKNRCSQPGIEENRSTNRRRVGLLMRKHPEIGAKNVGRLWTTYKAAIPYVFITTSGGTGVDIRQDWLGEKDPKGRAACWAIVDAFDAMTTNRPYHTSCRQQNALDRAGSLSRRLL